MSSNTTITIPGDIITIELPFSNHSGSKLRPVLVLSNEKFNKISRDIIVAKITGSSYEPKYEVILQPENLKSGKLKKTSFIDIAFITAVEKSLINKKIATLDDKTMSRVRDVFQSIFE